MNDLENLRGAASAEAIGYLTNRLGYLKLKARNETGAIDEFMSVAEGFVPASQADKAEANLRMGYLMYRNRKSEDAIKYFKRLATGEVSASASTASEAAMRLGALYHSRKMSEEAISTYE